MSQRAFANRTDGGRQLAAALEHLRDASAVVLGLPRGGVPVAFEIAQALGAPLDVIVVRKLGVPSQPELAMGAIGEDGVRFVNEPVKRAAGVDDATFAAVEAAERVELDRRAARYRGDRARVPLVDRTVVIVDDGIATGSTARAACRVARAVGVARIVLAAPIASPRSVEALRDVADEIVCVEASPDFFAIGEWYRDFSPTTDDDVLADLHRS